MKPDPIAVKLSVVPLEGRARGHMGTPVDGRYGAMDSRELQSAITRLTRQVDLRGVEYALGIPEGGYLPAHAFAAETGLLLVLASVSKPAGTVVVTFTEEHSLPHYAAKHIYGLAAGDGVIVVEDEVTTGRTIINCIHALRAAGIRCDQAATIYAADDPLMRARVAAEGIRLHAAFLCQTDINEQLHRR